MGGEGKAALARSAGVDDDVRGVRFLSRPRGHCQLTCRLLGGYSFAGGWAKAMRRVKSRPTTASWQLCYLAILLTNKPTLTMTVTWMPILSLTMKSCFSSSHSNAL